MSAEFNSCPKPAIDVVAWDVAKDPVPIPGTTWWTPNGSTIPVAEYEKEQEQRDEPIDIDRVRELGDFKKVHLETVILENGLRYVLIKDDFGDDVFKYHEYHGRSEGGPYVTSPEAARNIDLGQGYVLQFVLASEPYLLKSKVYTGGKSWTSIGIVDYSVDSYVKKQRSDPELEHDFSYSLDPFGHKFFGKYVVFDGTDVEQVEVMSGKDMRFSSASEITGDQVSISFGADGFLNQILIAGRYLLNNPRAQREFLVITESQRRGILELDRTDLNKALGRSVLTDVAGYVASEDEDIRNLRIDAVSLVEKIVRNVDSPKPVKPRQLFRDALSIDTE